MHVVSRTRLPRFESLEERLTLSAKHAAVVTPPTSTGGTVIVAPPNGLAPILLPSGLTLPSDTTTLPSPSDGLPVGLPPIAGEAEQLALTAFTNFQSAHPKAKLKLSDKLSKNGDFTLTLTATDGKGHSFTETIIENKSGVTVQMSLVDGQHSETLGAAQSSNGVMNALFVDAVFDSGHRTSTTFKSQINGHLNVLQF